LLTTLIDRIDVGADQIDIHLHPTRLAALLDVAATPLPSATEDEIQTLSIPVLLRRSGRAITMRIDGTDPFATAKPDARLVKLLIRARRFNAALVGSDGVPFAALAKRQGVSPSYFTRLVRLSYLAPGITEAILDGRQPPDLTAAKLLAHSRLPLGWHEQCSVLGFAGAGPNSKLGHTRRRVAHQCNHGSELPSGTAVLK
jgi:site-specific DNA recombinase